MAQRVFALLLSSYFSYVSSFFPAYLGWEEWTILRLKLCMSELKSDFSDIFSSSSAGRGMFCLA